MPLFTSEYVFSDDYPTIEPSLKLDFANARALDPRITFTRASTATYVGANGLIKTAGVDEARFDHDPSTGESLGLLIEEQRSNLFPTSEVFVSGWGGGGTTNTDTILNPYGVLGTVYYITGSERYRTFNATGYSTLAFSFFTKKRFGGLERDYTFIEIYQVAIGDGSLGNYYFRFNEDNLDTTYFKDVKREEYPNGWYRFSCRLIARPDYNGGVFSISTRVDIEGSVFDNYVWGLQVEAASFATSYIPTEGSTKTRTKDVAYIDGSNFTEWYNPIESTFFTSFRPAYNASATVPARTPHVFQAGNATTVNDNYSIRGAESNLYWTVLIRSASPSSLQFPGFNPYPYLNSSTQYKSALSVNSSLISVSLNGLLKSDEVNTTTVNHTTPFNKLFIGSGTGGGPPYELTGHIAQLTYYPKRLTNAQLQTLTQ